MTVISAQKESGSLALVIHSEFGAEVERVWQVWNAQHVLEKWWGPPSHPATFEEHDFRSGGTSSYFMTGPDGERIGGRWSMISVEAPNRIAFEDSFVDADGNPDPKMPLTRFEVQIIESDRSPGSSHMTVACRFQSEEAMEKMMEMGMDEGLEQTIGQIDDLL